MNNPVASFARAATPLDTLKRYLPWLVAVALFMEQLDATIINTAVPTMSASLGVAPLSLKAVLTSYALSLAVFIPISGWVADRFGTCRVFSAAISIFTVGSLLCGLSINLPMLVASRVLQGLGGAMMMPVGRLSLVRTFPRSEMLAAMNFVVIPALLGPMLGPLVGGLIVHWLPWRAIFFINLPIGLAGLWLARRYMPDYRADEPSPLDARGFLLFGSGVALLSYVLEVFGEHGLTAGPVLLLFALSLLLLAAYGLHAAKARHPVLQLRLFKVRTFAISVTGSFVTRLGVGGLPFLLPLLYQIGLGYEPWQAGLLTMPLALAAMTMKLASRPILERFGHRRVLIVNTVCLGLMISGFSQVGPGTPVAVIVTMSLVQGFFSSLQFTSMNSLAYADIDDRQASMASSITSTMQQLSMSFGVATASLVTAWFLGGIAQTDRVQLIGALHHAYLALGFVTIVSSFTFHRLKPGDGSNISNHQAEEEAESREG